MVGTVSAWADSSYSAVEADVAPDGTFELPGLNGTSYWILFRSADPLTAVSGWYATDDRTLVPQETMLDGVRVSAGADIVMRPVAPRVVSGTVQAPPAWDGALEDLDLTLHATTTAGRTSRTDVPVASDGSFRIGLAPHLTHRLRLDSGTDLVTGYWDRSGSTVRTFGEATVIDDTVDSVLLAPALLSTLHGRVAMPSGYTYAKGTLTVRASTWNDENWYPTGETAAVAADGTFSLADLPTGQGVLLWFADSRRQLVGGYVDGATGAVGADRDSLVTVVGHEVEIRTVLAASVRGTVVVPAGYDWSDSFKPYVELLDPDTDEEVGSVSLRDGGTGFTFRGLAPGAEYLLRLADGSGQLVAGYLTDAATGALSRKRSDAVVVRGDGPTLTLRPAVNLAISGRLVLPDGPAPAYENVTLRYADDGSWAGSRSTDANGRFRFTGLPSSGSYLLEYGATWSTTAVGGYYSATEPYLVTSVDRATPVRPGSSTVTLRARPSTSMSGRVVKPTGFTGSLEYTTVTAYSDGVDDGMHDVYAEVEKDGTFRIRGLDPTRFYTLGYNGSGLVRGFLGADGSWETSGSRAALVAPQSGVTLRPPLASRLTGRVQLPGGVTWSDVQLELGTENGRWINVSRTGAFVVPDLQPYETVRLTLEDRSGVVAGGWYVSDDTPLTRDSRRATAVPAGTGGLVLRPIRTTTLQGQVVLPEGVDAASVHVELIASAVDGEASVRDARAEVGADGGFVLRGLDPDVEYDLHVDEASGTLATGRVFASGRTVPSPTDASTMAPAELPRTIRLSRAGTIEVQVTLPGTAGITYSSPTVRAYDLSGNAVASSTARASGVALLTNLAQDGEYLVRLSGTGVGTGWYHGEGAPLVAGRSVATSVPGRGTISVVATDAASVTGRVAPSAVDDGSSSVVVVDTATGEIVASDYVDPGHSFVLGGLLPGEYLIGANLDDAWSWYAPTYYAAGSTGTVPRDSATVVSLEPRGKAAGVVLAADACVTWSGFIDEVVDDDEVATVRVWDDGLVVRTWDGDEGEDAFVLRGLAPGTYHVGLAIDAGPERRLDDVTFTSCDDVAGARLGAHPAVHAITEPKVTGTRRVGSTLKVTSGTWAPSPATVAYQWLRGGTPIPGATSATYRLTPSDLGRSVKARVTARLVGLREGVRVVGPWGEVERGVLGAGRVSLTGKAALGSTLTAAVTGWSGSTVTWRWERDGAPISGASSARYAITKADVGHQVRATATAVRYGYTPAVATSAARTPVFSFVALSPPKLSGTVAVGSRVTASRGTWSAAPKSVRYTWLRSGAPIAGATRATYAPVAADVGKKLAVRVTATLTGYPSASAVSTTSTVVAGTIKNVTRPTVTGTARVGATVRVSPGRWSVPGVTVRYQWLRDGRAIAGATKATYTARSADVRTRLSVRVTASKPGYRSAATTASTRAVTTPAAAYL
ncbi:hypothetical protein KIN34_11025 [Cellulomonas sp. DKR-3]|uniref:Alpha-amylase n=1 Tax=Cellulomonas fulva TaxID=2835530 RepID=A0ABS5U0E6_9CELL|nr:carboxypeptidase-like regulatory domain-containing protein [Cellulomonas fulva]MBT0994812.1 hypothetical protein [Cellulomonas fulva]